MREHRGERYVKKFTCRQHLVAMLYAQLSGAGSLRTLEAGLNAQRGQLYALRMGPVSRSTLGDANRRRNPQVYADVLRELIAQAGRLNRGQRGQMLYLLDSTSIPLRGRGFDWCEATATRTPGLKLHVLYDSGAQQPAHQTITPANVNDLQEGRRLQIQEGATYVFDKGYCDYNWWSHIDESGARFVSRLKSNAAVRPHDERQPDAAHILSDCIVSFAYRSSRGGHRNLYDRPVRRIEVAREHDKPLVLVSNDLQSPASEIAALYKQRWEIELFFKWIKQHLRIKRFLGRSDNAVRIQLLTALIAYLLLMLLKTASGAPQSLWLFTAEVQASLFQRPQPELSRWRRRKRQDELFQTVQPGLFQ